MVLARVPQVDEQQLDLSPEHEIYHDAFMANNKNERPAGSKRALEAKMATP